MKKRTHHSHHVTHHKKVTGTRVSQDYLVLVRGWMFIVLFAVMLGVGVIVGNFINQQLNVTPSQVAGAQTTR